ncbi:MAG: trypsin-like serine protease [Halieaceae bacterium]|nr:trypsin-like serine protease [Halieaceae bacterium]
MPDKHLPWLANTRYTALLLVAGWLVVNVQASEREVFDAQSPQVLQAVGKLTVPGHDRVDGRRRSREENCTASLVAPSTILTAWHCLEYYSDLSRDPQFALPGVMGGDTVAATRIADGGGMEADWALLRLARPIRQVDPLPVTKTAAPDNARLLLAGYARDTGLGNRGEHLTWQANCRLRDREITRVGTDCVTYKGASGGPVLLNGHVVGVISAGDSEERTYFAPFAASNRFFSLYRLHAR